jgi:hypothetical protein
VIDGGHVLGQAQRVAQRQHLHRDADLHLLGGDGQRRGDDQRRGQHRAVLLEVQLGEPDRVVAEVLGQTHLGHRLVEGRAVRAAGGRLELREQPELHRHALAAVNFA